MKVLLLGPNGQLGSDIRRIHEAAGEPFELVPLGRDELDVATPGILEPTLDEHAFNVLINCTGYHRTDEAEDDATLAFTVNAHAVQAMARACARKHARFIHISTDYVFGGDTARTQPLVEDDPTAPLNVYGASKALGERLARLASEGEACIVRVASLFGVTGASGKGGNFVETMIRTGREKRALRVVADQAMSPTATADIARVILRFLTNGDGGPPPGTWHVVNSGAASWFDFASEIIRQAGIAATVTPCSTRDYPTRAMRPPYSVLDNSKIGEMFGDMPPWQEALERYLRARGHTGGAGS